MPRPCIACSCPSLHSMGPILIHHLLRRCWHMFIIFVLMAHRCWIIMLCPPSWMVWTFICSIFQVPDSYQRGCRILGYQMIWYGLYRWVSGPLTFQRTGPCLVWEFTQCRHFVLLMLRIYPLAHWWLPCINCEILFHRTFSLLLITASSYCQHNRCLPCCTYHIYQWYLPRGPLHQVLGLWLPWT